MKEIKHETAIRLIENVLDCIPQSSSGTYNRQDPTAFSKGSVDTEYKGMRIRLSYDDCTWGITLTISKLVPRFPDVNPIPEYDKDFYWKEKDLGEFYLTWDRELIDGKWINVSRLIPRQKTSGLLKFLHILKKNLEPVPLPVYDEDEGMGCPSMYM